MLNEESVQILTGRYEQEINVSRTQNNWKDGLVVKKPCCSIRRIRVQFLEFTSDSAFTYAFNSTSKVSDTLLLPLSATVYICTHACSHVHAHAHINVCAHTHTHKINS